ncbi:MAG: NAD-dependent epimerase/dehydratase family protein [Ignavibacteriales bacterium]|nr:NAD-dependent epimerase/dehydratase family protein [Ignavibacteriales bacterium]MCF8316434.1 NAD-dependent epimerase/dehydratase family protein [Ignavibacteriales bacterium]MCF8437914.1 NAD-dependent epimerase/dehydratase family protein [Ignavibacteriales bacterium]
MIKKKIVVTGGAGFIGSHIAEEYTKIGYDVHIIDNLRTGKIENLNDFEGYTFHNFCITEKEKVYEVLTDADFVFHLAALVSVPQSFVRFDECLQINVFGLTNVLNAARDCGVKKVIFSSSSAVYGDNPISPKKVDLPLAPKSPYGITKVDGEFYLKMYYEQYGLKSVSLRYFNVFGPRQEPEGAYAAAISIFVSHALKNQPITIYGDGQQTRDFIFVKDVVNANIISADSDIHSGIFNIATGSSITISDIAKLVISETGSKSKIIFAPARTGDIKHSVADIKDTEEILGFKPSFDLIHGLKTTIKYFSDLFGG